MNSFISNSISFIETKSKEILQLDSLNSPDYLLLTPLVDKPSIGIKEVQSLVQKAFRKPFAGDSKVFVIKQADTMTEEAQNSLLKIIEEPPLNTYFFLETQNQLSLLPTIRSRCCIFFADTQNYRFTNSLPTLESVLKMNYEQRFGLIQSITDNKELQNKTYILELIDKLIFESQTLNAFSKIVTLCLESKQFILGNVTPKNALELLFLKLPLWSQSERT